MSDQMNDTRIALDEAQALEAENEQLRKEIERLSRQTQDVARANARAAELMAKLEEANEGLDLEVRKRAAAEEELRRVNTEIDATVRRQTADLTAANEQLIRQVSEREVLAQTLQESKQRLDAIFDAILTTVFIVDAESHQIVDANPLAVKMVGLPKAEILGRVCHKFICPAEQGRCPICDLGQSVDHSERIFLKADGTRIPIIKTVTAASWQGHQYLVESFIDISDRKQAEQRQADLLDQLTRINQELKEFAYIVSHDLKAPLRGIKALADWITADYAEKLGTEGKEQLSLLTGRVDRMQGLIDGILQYSRIGREGEKQSPIDLNAFLPGIVDMLAPPPHIHITVQGGLPILMAQEIRMTQVFQNLISNAIKYMDKPQGRIHVACTEANGVYTFSVADNGPGIEEKYFERIFKLFQTLAPRDSCESTGVGLAVVKKIVEMYGGRIWVKSKVGEGSTFFFTFPKNGPSVGETIR
jgi:two-component system, LuxR family, sensor kinase FixL